MAYKNIEDRRAYQAKYRREHKETRKAWDRTQWIKELREAGYLVIAPTDREYEAVKKLLEQAEGSAEHE